MMQILLSPLHRGGNWAQWNKLPICPVSHEKAVGPGFIPISWSDSRATLGTAILCSPLPFTVLRHTSHACAVSTLEFQWHILNYYLPHLSFHVGPWPHHTWMCGKCLADKRVTSYKILPITHGSQSLIHENELTNSSGGWNKGMFLPCSLQFLPPRQRALWHSWFSLKRCGDQAKRVSKTFHFSIPDWRQVQVCAGSDTSSFNTPPTPPKKVSYCPAPSH